MKSAKLTCPKCGHIQEVEVPQTACLAFHECEQCGLLMSVPESSENCCVVCEYGDKKCSVARA